MVAEAVWCFEREDFFEVNLGRKSTKKTESIHMRMI
jgi:hypothetical protein